MFYGVILNDRTSLARIGNLDEAPYKGAPKAPALYIKPAGTRAASGDVISLPGGAEAVEIGATLGLVMGGTVSGVSEAKALAHVSGVVLAADLSLPHTSYYRPPIREKCFDQSLVLSQAVPLCAIEPLVLHTLIDGAAVEARPLNDLVRSPARLLADVSAFMTLEAGDVLLIGVRYKAAQARKGQAVRLEAAGFAPLSFSIAGEVA